MAVVDLPTYIHNLRCSPELLERCRGPNPLHTFRMSPVSRRVAFPTAPTLACNISNLFAAFCRNYQSRHLAPSSYTRKICDFSRFVNSIPQKRFKLRPFCAFPGIYYFYLAWPGAYQRRSQAYPSTTDASTCSPVNGVLVIRRAARQRTNKRSRGQVTQALRPAITASGRVWRELR